MDAGGPHEKAELSRWMSQLFEKLDLEMDEEDLCSIDKKTNNGAHSLKRDENSQKRGLFRPSIGARYPASDDEAKEYYNTKRRLTYGGRPLNEMDRMTDECLLAFKNYAQNSNLEDTEYKFGELRRRCYKVQAHGKIYQHFNFTMQTKLGNSGIWTSKLYFAEVKELSSVKHYFCCPLEATDDGDCFECERQNIGILKHPCKGGYEEGYSDKFNLYMVD